MSRSKREEAVWLLGLRELPRPLHPGDQVTDADGRLAHVFEVRRLRSSSFPVAGQHRDLFAVLHAGAGSVVVAVCLRGEQREWQSLTRKTRRLFERGAR